MTIDSVKQEELTDAVRDSSLQTQKERGPKLRQLHPKSHGLVSGKFTIEKNISEKCKVGVFAQPKEYDIWVRFSNGSPPKEHERNVLHPDQKGDVRGMAIKLKNVAGEKVPSDEDDTQDFVLINHHVFFLPDVQGYIDFGQFQASPNPELEKKLEDSLKILGAINNKIIGNPLSIQYWSTTPYKLGSNFIKFSVKPHELETSPSSLSSLPKSESYLREVMVKYLTTDQKQATFDFFIQFYVDEDQTPIENPMKEWEEAVSPSIKVATITIPSQIFDCDERKKLDESLSFTPWHTLPEHEPVGSVNLSRRRIYQATAEARRRESSE